MVGPHPHTPEGGVGCGPGIIRYSMISHAGQVPLGRMQSPTAQVQCAGCSLHVITCCIILCRAHTPHYPFVGVCGLPHHIYMVPGFAACPKVCRYPYTLSALCRSCALLAWWPASCSPQVCPKHITTRTHMHDLWYRAFPPSAIIAWG